MKNKIDLCGVWSFCDEQGNRHQGTVPGCVHTDLFESKYLFFEKNSEKCRFIEEHDWNYEKYFQVEDLQNGAELVFEGLDTYCEVYLNDIFVGKADNMFIPHRFAVDGVLRAGENHLEVRFQSPVRAVQGKKSLPGAFTTERLYSRRMQCTYGWDWVDRFVTCGIYRPVYVEFEDHMALEDVYVYTNNIDSYGAQIKVVQNFKNYTEGNLIRTEICDCDGNLVQRTENYCAEKQSVLYFDIENPKLWYPRPYGEQPLYTLRMIVGEDITEQKFGIRTVKILQLEDKDAQIIEQCQKLQQTESGVRWDRNERYFGFILIVNGKKIYCTGANWVPCEPFPSAETKDKITKILGKAVDSGINMIRVWGGGLFEQQHFYEECDRLGILVSQDFLMACGEYPEKELWFQQQLKKEAEYAAVYLRNHPSLVWWTGDNENAVEGCDTDKDYQGRSAAKKVIAEVLERLDHNRVFLFSSPYGGKKYASKTCGTTHNTQFLEFTLQYMQKEEISDYKEYWQDLSARFIAEEPIFGAVCQNSLTEFIDLEHQNSYELWLYHTKNNPAFERELMDMMVDFAEKLFGTYKSWEDKYFKMRYLQYEWVRYTLSFLRSSLWFNSGIIYWMLNDCWPASMGWSLIDYYTREKAGYYAMKHFGKPVNVYIKKSMDEHQVTVSNILGKELKERLKLKLSLLNIKTGDLQAVYENTYEQISDKICETIQSIPNEDEILIAEVMTETISVRNWYKEGNINLIPITLQWECLEDRITVRSDSYVHVVELSGAENVSDNYFSLLPGEKREIYCDTKKLQINAYTIGENLH